MQDQGISEDQYRELEKLANDQRDGWEVTLDLLVEVLGEISGFNSIKGCFGGDGVMVCVDAFINLVPWSKLFKVLGNLGRIVNAFRKGFSWASDVAAARNRVTKIQSAVDAARSAAMRSCRPNSFVPGTLVVMADGSHKPIEDVQVGDEVYATDPVTGETGTRTVVATIVGGGVKDLVEVTIDTDGDAGDQTDTVTATGGHPFWVDDQGRWVSAGDLREGDDVRTRDGAEAEVLAISTYTQVHAVHNLTVRDIHTYHVVVGDIDVIVHNDGAPPLGEHGDKIFYRGYSYRLDPVPGGSGQFEIHVYNRGVEVGFYGSDGWFNKHGLKGSSGINTADLAQVENGLKGIAVDYMRRSGLLKREDSVKGDSWKRPRC